MKMRYNPSKKIDLAKLGATLLAVGLAFAGQISWWIVVLFLLYQFSVVIEYN